MSVQCVIYFYYASHLTSDSFNLQCIVQWYAILHEISKFKMAAVEIRRFEEIKRTIETMNTFNVLLCSREIRVLPLTV